MKSIYTILIITLLAAGCSSKKTNDPTPEPPVKPATPDPDPENNEPKPISKYVGILTPYTDGQPNSSRDAIFDTEAYNNNGKLLMKEYQVGLIDQELPYTYRLDYKYEGGVIAQVKKQATVPRLSSYEETFYYQGLPMYTLVTYDDQVRIRIENEYNNERKLSRVFTYNLFYGPKKLTSHDSLTYENNRVKEHHYISHDQVYHAKLGYIYDTKGKVVKENFTNILTGATAVHAEYTYVYNEKDQLTEYIVDYAGLRHKHVNEYNSEGRIKLKKIFQGPIHSTNLEQTGVVNYTYTYR